MQKTLSVLFIFISFLNGYSANGQVNYVLNPSFEQYSLCPPGPDNIRLAYHWSQIDTVSSLPVCSAEYCNACDHTHGFGVPNGDYYYQYPRSGNGMMQANMYFDKGYIPEIYERDYMQGRLYTHLTSGKNYCVTFYVNLEELSQYAINHIGAYLDNGSIDVGQDSAGCASPQTAYVPQVYATTIINDTFNWVKVQGSFIADGTERFITIGNFFDLHHTDTLRVYTPIANNFAYYLFDDVSVIESTEVAHAGPDKMIATGDSVHIGTNEEGMPNTWYKAGDTIAIGYSGGIWVKPDTTTTYVVEMDLCGHVTYDTMTVWVWPVGTSPQPSPKEREVWPNPVGNELHIDNATNSTIVIYDLMGRVVYKTILSLNKETINIKNLPNGVYVVQIVDIETGYKAIKRIIKE